MSTTSPPPADDESEGMPRSASKENTMTEQPTTTDPTPLVCTLRADELEPGDVAILHGHAETIVSVEPAQLRMVYVYTGSTSRGYPLVVPEEEEVRVLRLHEQLPGTARVLTVLARDLKGGDRFARHGHLFTVRPPVGTVYNPHCMEIYCSEGMVYVTPTDEIVVTRTADVPETT